MPRCFGDQNDLYAAYHDEEWGVPSRDDRHLFEHLVLGGAQAGLSWEVILKKRDEYRKVFQRFDPAKMARYTPDRVEEIIENPGIVRNRLKVESAVKNAKAFLAVQKEFGSFSKYAWAFVGGKPRQNQWETMKDVPTRTPESDALSESLRKHGFNFVGSTIVYAWMQAVGMVNDHHVGCPRRAEVAQIRAKSSGRASAA